MKEKLVLNTLTGDWSIPGIRIAALEMESDAEACDRLQAQFGELSSAVDNGWSDQLRHCYLNDISRPENELNFTRKIVWKPHFSDALNPICFLDCGSDSTRLFSESVDLIFTGFQRSNRIPISVLDFTSVTHCKLIGEAGVLVAKFLQENSYTMVVRGGTKLFTLQSSAQPPTANCEDRTKHFSPAVILQISDPSSLLKLLVPDKDPCASPRRSPRRQRRNEVKQFQNTVLSRLARKKSLFASSSRRQSISGAWSTFTETIDNCTASIPFPDTGRSFDAHLSLFDVLHSRCPPPAPPKNPSQEVQSTGQEEQDRDPHRQSSLRPETITRIPRQKSHQAKSGEKDPPRQENRSTQDIKVSSELRSRSKSSLPDDSSPGPSGSVATPEGDPPAEPSTTTASSDIGDINPVSVPSFQELLAMKEAVLQGKPSEDGQPSDSLHVYVQKLVRSASSAPDEVDLNQLLTDLQNPRDHALAAMIHLEKIAAQTQTAGEEQRDGVVQKLAFLFRNLHAKGFFADVMKILTSELLPAYCARMPQLF
ncbi:unnamed protein product, partial [Cyprideis torosa]